MAVSGDFERWQREEIDLKRKADLYVLDVASQEMQEGLAKRTGEALGARMSRTWRRRLYKNPKDPAALIYSRAPDIITTFLAETIIVPKKGRYLAIPTGFNRAGGQRGAKVRVTPKEMIASGMSFTRPRKGGDGLIWFLQIAHAQDRNQRLGSDGKIKYGKVYDVAMAGGMLNVGRRGRRARDAIKARAVPMFVLVKQAHHTQSIDADGILREVANRSDGYYAEAYQIFDTGSAT